MTTEICYDQTKASIIIIISFFLTSSHCNICGWNKSAALSAKKAVNTELWKAIIFSISLNSSTTLQRGKNAGYAASMHQAQVNHLFHQSHVHTHTHTHTCAYARTQARMHTALKSLHSYALWNKPLTSSTGQHRLFFTSKCRQRKTVWLGPCSLISRPERCRTMHLHACNFCGD